MKQIIFLIGMSGAGKTAWGRKLAAHYGLPFFDIDLHIEENTGRTISQIFTVQGEASFRKMESEALREIVRDNDGPLVLSCGGGTPLDSANLEFMKQHGVVVYLRAEIVTLIHNLQDEAAQRPLLKNDVISPAARLSELLAKRRKIYERADYILPVENLAIQDFAPILQACTRQD